MALEPTAAEMFERGREDYRAKGRAIPPETMAYIVGVSQAESLKRLADIAEAWARGSFNYEPGAK